jgi:hypothetical protein
MAVAPRSVVVDAKDEELSLLRMVIESSFDPDRSMEQA